MDYELLAVDLDGTLTNTEKKVTEPTKEGILAVQKAGEKLVLATGRPDNGVMPLAKELELDQYGNYVISFNGAKIRQCGSGEIIFNAVLPHEVIRPIYEIAKEYPVDMAVFDTELMYSGLQANSYTEFESKMITGMPCVFVQDLPGVVDFPINCILLTGEPEYMLHLEKVLKEQQFSDLLNIYRSEPFFLEILPKSVDKAYSLQKLLEYLEMEPEQTICCGDGYNDISMLQYAGLGVAMGNACEEVQEAADYVTGTNEEDGVLQVIRKFMLS